jgi:aspartate aminotransferase/aminotransferase
VQAIAKIASHHGVLLVRDEIYRAFCHDLPFTSPLEFNDDVLVVDGFGKTYAMTGWRLGWAHGPATLIREMIKLQQFTYVCAPSVAQHAGLAAMDHDAAAIVADYRDKRDRLRTGLEDLYDLGPIGGAFYLFPRAPRDSASDFVTEAINHSLLCIPGNVFGRRDTHFRLSYAVPDHTLDRAITVLRRLATRS